MKAVVQRVSDASVSVEGEITGQINYGLLVYLGVALEDDTKDADWLAEKIPHLRIFDDTDGKMNLSLIDIVNGVIVQVNNDDNQHRSTVNENSVGILAISQFTLLGDAKKGRRPSWSKAAPPEKAQELFAYFIDIIRKQGLICETGKFQARMKVSYANEGPVTILLDSKE
jgi:D-tyrosyl-tRNA(Tyr) deacylase